MTPEHLRELIAGGESLAVEFKGEERRPLADDELVEAGLVEARGERKGRSYHLSAATYRRLGHTVGYVHQRGFEPLQQEQMVLQYVEKHGRITRRETAELCRLGSDQAKRLLARLTDAGRLRRQGRGRGVTYVLAQ